MSLERVTVSYSIIAETANPDANLVTRDQVENVTVTRDTEIGAVAAAVLHLIETRGDEFRQALIGLIDLIGPTLTRDLVAERSDVPPVTYSTRVNDALHKYADAVSALGVGLAQRGIEGNDGPPDRIVAYVLELIDDLRKPVEGNGKYQALGVINGIVNRYVQGAEPVECMAKISAALRHAGLRT